MMKADQSCVQNDVVVFDKAIRFYHSMQLLLLPALWYTAERELFGLHQYLAVLLTAMLLARICWAVIGSSTARFADFVPTPATLWRYLRSPWQTAGHNPLSGLMILTLWLVLLLQFATGLFITDDVMFEGPLYGVGATQWQAFAGFWHHNGLNILLALVALHVGGALWHQSRGDKVITAISRGHKPLLNPTRTLSHKPFWQYLLLLAVFMAAAHGWLGNVLWQMALSDWQTLLMS